MLSPGEVLSTNTDNFSHGPETPEINYRILTERFLLSSLIKEITIIPISIHD